MVIYAKVVCFTELDFDSMWSRSFSTPCYSESDTCPPPRDLSAPVAPPGLRTTGEIESILLYSLNLGASPEQLVSELNTPAYDNPNLKLTRIDFNNDGVEELAISSGPSLLNGTPFISGPVSVFWVFECRNESYQIEATVLEARNTLDGDPEIVYIGDLKGNKQKEVVVQSSVFLGSQCRKIFDILAWKVDTITSYLDARTTFPCGTKFSVGRPDENGNKEILFTGPVDVPPYIAAMGIHLEFADIYALKDDQSYILRWHGYLLSL